jgi:beta-lactamase superfamily II metal-dependent hydrolase
LPHPDVIERLATRGTLVLSTAELGAIRVITDGRELRVESAREGRLVLR